MFVYFSLQLYPKVKDNLRPLAITILLLPLSLSCLKFTNVWFTTEKKKKWNKTMKFWIENWPTCFKFLTRKMMETHATKTIFIFFLLSMILYSQTIQLLVKITAHTQYIQFTMPMNVHSFSNSPMKELEVLCEELKVNPTLPNRWNRPDNRQII